MLTYEFQQTSFEGQDFLGLFFPCLHTRLMIGVDAYIKANPKDFPASAQARVLDILKRKNERYAVKGNSWQNVFPKHLRAYQDWWARLQAA